MFTKKVKYLEMVGLGLVLTVFLTMVFVVSGESQSNVIKIGCAISFSGGFADQGGMVRESCDLWKDTVNQKGGINVGGKNYKVEIIYYDDKSDAQTAATLTEKLITQDKVNFIFGPFGSGLTMASSAIAEKYQIIMIASLSNADKVYERGFKYLFSIYGPLTKDFPVYVDLWDTLVPKPKRIAILTPDDMYPASAAEAAHKKAVKAGYNIVYYEKFPMASTDLSAVVTEIKGKTPDALLMTGQDDQAVMLMKQMAELKVNVAFIGLQNAPYREDFRKSLGKNAEYVFGSTWWDPNANYKDILFGSTRSYIDLYKKRYAKDVTIEYQACPAAGGVVLMKAIEKAGSLDSKKVRDAVANLDIETFYIPVKYDERGLNVGGSTVLGQVQDGHVVPIFPKRIAVAPIRYPMPKWKD